INIIIVHFQSLFTVGERIAGLFPQCSQCTFLGAGINNTCGVQESCKLLENHGVLLWLLAEVDKLVAFCLNV
ncbi:hypothetical protein DOY81_005059, partial [Sarcophaga bullata]